MSKLIGDNQFAEDILQETYLIIWKKLWLLKEPSAFKAWAYRIANREALRHLKKEKRVFIEYEDSLVSEQLEQEEHKFDINVGTTIDLDKLIMSLSNASRAVFLLRYFEEKSLQEISSILEIPMGTVKSRLSYGLTQIKKMISQEFSSPNKVDPKVKTTIEQK